MTRRLYSRLTAYAGALLIVLGMCAAAAQAQVAGPTSPATAAPTPIATSSATTLITGGAAAGVTNPITTILNTVRTQSQTWFTIGQNLALSLFWVLASADLAWTGIQLLMQGAEDIKTVVAGMLSKILALAFFSMFIANAGTWVPTILNGFVCAGWTLAGQGTNASCTAGAGLSLPGADPTAILGVGLSLAGAMFNHQSFAALLSNPGAVIGTVLCAILIVLSFAFIAAQLFLALVEAYFIYGAGIIMMGFTGSRWTANLGEKYIGYMTNVGTKLMVMILVVSLGDAVMNELVTLFGGFEATSPGGQLLATFNGTAINPAQAISLNFTTYLAVVALVSMFAYLCYHIPQSAGTLLSGQPSLSLAQVANVARGAVGAGLGLAAGGVGAAIAAKGALSAGTGLASKLAPMATENSSQLLTARPVGAPASATSNGGASMFGSTDTLALPGGGGGGDGSSYGGAGGDPSTASKASSTAPEASATASAEDTSTTTSTSKPAADTTSKPAPAPAAPPSDTAPKAAAPTRDPNMERARQFLDRLRRSIPQAPPDHGPGIGGSTPTFRH